MKTVAPLTQVGIWLKLFDGSGLSTFFSSLSVPGAYVVSSGCAAPPTVQIERPSVEGGQRADHEPLPGHELPRSTSSN